MWNGFKYVNEEFIEATQDINSLSNLEIMEHIINVISDLYKIDVKNKKITWANNSEFLKFNIKNLKEVLIHKNSLELNDYIFEIDNLFENLDNNRKLCFIHGDIHKKNMIINNDSFYLIDWELSTYGDLAYELAIHFILMDYTENEKVVFLSKLSELITLDFEKLKSDIKVYINFELYRRNVLKLIKDQ